MPHAYAIHLNSNICKHERKSQFAFCHVHDDDDDESGGGLQKDVLVGFSTQTHVNPMHFKKTNIHIYIRLHISPRMMCHSTRTSPAPFGAVPNKTNKTHSTHKTLHNIMDGTYA